EDISRNIEIPTAGGRGQRISRGVATRNRTEISRAKIEHVAAEIVCAGIRGSGRPVQVDGNPPIAIDLDSDSIALKHIGVDLNRRTSIVGQGRSIPVQLRWAVDRRAGR